MNEYSVIFKKVIDDLLLDPNTDEEAKKYLMYLDKKNRGNNTDVYQECIKALTEDHKNE